MRSEGAFERFAGITRLPDDEIDLARAALLVAANEYPLLDIEDELRALDSLAAGASRRLERRDDPLLCLNTLSEYLFDEVGFRGNKEDYYDPRNSFLNDVLSRRLGLPITLSLVYMEVGKRLGVPIVGVGVPGHFLLRHLEVQDLFIDPFNGGILLSEDECAERLNQVAQAPVPWDPGYLEPVGKREFIGRLIGNLKAVYLRRPDYAHALTVINLLLALHPESAYERRDRGLVHYHLGHHGEALYDLQRYLDSASHIPDGRMVEELVGRLRELSEN